MPLKSGIISTQKIVLIFVRKRVIKIIKCSVTKRKILAQRSNREIVIILLMLLMLLLVMLLLLLLMLHFFSEHEHFITSESLHFAMFFELLTERVGSKWKCWTVVCTS